jgi:MoaA/NifB/PqqE/SkfB family radical SAM enzyme
MSAFAGADASQARLMRQSGIQGASIGLDSTDPKKHDTFRHLPGAWQGAVRAAEEAAWARLTKVPSFAWGMVVKAVETFARAKGSHEVTPEPLQEAKKRWTGEGRYPFAARS